MSVETPLNTAIGRRLRALREERRMPRERLALALEMSSENLRNYESGKQKLTLTMLPTIAAIYDISLENLLSELFELRSAPAGRSDSGTMRHPDRHSESENTHAYSETNPRREQHKNYPHRVLALA